MNSCRFLSPAPKGQEPSERIFPNTHICSSSGAVVVSPGVKATWAMQLGLPLSVNNTIIVIVVIIIITEGIRQTAGQKRRLVASCPSGICRCSDTRYLSRYTNRPSTYAHALLYTDGV